MATDIEALVRASYRAYETGDRAAIEALIGDPFSFTSPYDDHIDRTAYFERCWPNHARIAAIDILRLFVKGEEALVLYEVLTAADERFRNTEFLRFADGRLREVEVYFGSPTRTQAERSAAPPSS